MQRDARPVLRLSPGQGRRLRAGAPWVFSNEIAMRPEYRRLPPGGLVRLEADDGGRFGTFMFNPHSLIAARLLDRDPDAEIDVVWLRQRLAAAIALRGRLCDGVFHRLVHAEADRLPGLVIDRYDDVAVLAANTAGMELLTPLIVEALLALLPLRTIVGRNDSASRKLEGLPEGVTLLHGSDATTVVVEGGVRFPVDLLTGQKTGWFFDQRGNRDRVAGLASRIAAPVLSGLGRATDLRTWATPRTFRAWAAPRSKVARMRPRRPTARACWTCSATPVRLACAVPRRARIRCCWWMRARRLWISRCRPRH